MAKATKTIIVEQIGSPIRRPGVQRQTLVGLGLNKLHRKVSLARVQAAVDAKKLDAGATVDATALVKAGVIRRVKDGVRVLSTGELKAKLAFDVAGASKAAVEKIEKAGGSVKLPEKPAAE